MKRPSRLSDPVTGALIDPETGEPLCAEAQQRHADAKIWEVFEFGLLEDDDA